MPVLEEFKNLPTFDNMGKSKQTKISRWTSLEKLNLAEFSGKLVRPKVYENDHKTVLGIWMDLEWKVKYSTILGFKAIFPCQKSTESF